jgi:Rrf2 family iron-sulfur cluster assembly transcriptional regulator
LTLSKFARYALYAVLEMAVAGEEPVTVGRVAEPYGIPSAALAKVFQQLVRAGLATGTRGVGGGYRLARPPDSITVLDVVSLFEPPRQQGHCLLNDDAGRVECAQPHACSLHQLFEEIDGQVRYTMASVTFETLARRSMSHA